MSDDRAEVTAGPDGVVRLICALQREALLGACDWLIAFERQSQHEGLSVGELDESLDHLAEAQALRERLAQDAVVLAVPLGIVPELITELAERIEEAARAVAVQRIADLSELLVALDGLPRPGA